LGKTCNSPICLTGLETCIKNDCYGAKDCKAIIDQEYPTCSRCVTDILDPNTQATVGGNNYFVCDSSDNLQVTACLFYCRVYYFPYGQCIRQNNLPICKCLEEAPLITTTAPPYGSLLLTIAAHTDYVSALTTLPNGDLVSGSWDNTIKIWHPIDGSLKKILTGHTDDVEALTILQNGDLASGSDDRTIIIWNADDGTIKRTLSNHTSWITSLTTLPNGDLVSGSGDII
jgi:WD40 repeat protein